VASQKLAASHQGKRVLPRTSIKHDPLNRNSLETFGDTVSLSSPRSSLSSARPSFSSARPSLSNDGTTATGPPPVFTESDVELLETIIMDIDRLFPGDEFFCDKNPASHECKRSIIEILYVWSKCNPNIGYKQGFHEILGLVYMNLYKESVIIPSTNTLSQQDYSILNLVNRKYLCHDCFTIFNKFVVESTLVAKFYESEDNLWKSIESFNVSLMKIDQLIHYNLITRIHLESQLWIIRYLRLLLLREIGDLNSTSLLWDKLVATTTSTSSSLQLLPEMLTFMVIQLLIQIKSELITCDFSESIGLLLHYPIESKLGDEKRNIKFIHNLYHDAMCLYERRNDDLQLYEYGIKMNSKYNPDMKVSISYNGKPTDGTSSKAQTMKFEKTRLEMRLKKKAQQLLNKPSQ
jgi:TBC1 domain family protein 5